jgi:putative protease
MKSELLLPVGNMSMCLAAIHHGADAVYFGVPYFNARGRTTDFNLDELKEMIDLCHLYGVRTNLAFNVVIFQDEFPKVVELLENILPLGPDAFIVQDLGLASLIREMAPNQRIHASTQMTVTNPDAIKLLADLKIDRFVLGRENSLSDIKEIRNQTDKELEVFVHGAL